MGKRDKRRPEPGRLTVREIVILLAAVTALVLAIYGKSPV